MPTYRCYFFNREGHIVGPAEIIDAAEPPDAIDKALAMLGARPHYARIEVWDGERMVYPSLKPG